MRIDRGEQVGTISNAFRRPEKEKTVWEQGVLKHGEQPALHGRLQVNEHIAAGEEVELGKGRIREQVVGWCRVVPRL